MKNENLFENRIIYKEDKAFPELLKKIKKPPEKLYVMGNISLLNKPSIAVVGSRNFSEYGNRMTKKFTKGLVQEGFLIVSGLALGIDSFAHETCICSGGKTIAVIACGFNNIYPSENKNLYEKIVKTGGCVISEYPPHVMAKKEYFPNRNRLISGLCLGTLVIEANYRSGTSITAKYCIQQNRKLFCIPNSIDSKNAMGTNNLIKKGATLVTDIEDITRSIGVVKDKVKIEYTKSNEKEEKMTLSKDELKIYNCIKKGQKSADEIAMSTNLDISKINIILSMMELESYIVRLSTNKYKVKEDD